MSGSTPFFDQASSGALAPVAGQERATALPHDLVAEDQRHYLSEQAIKLLARFAHHAVNLPWFARLGDPIDRHDAKIARIYLSGLGFPRVLVAKVPDFEAAAIAAETLDRDGAGFEAEEGLRADLTEQAYQRLDPETLESALHAIQAQVGVAVLARVEELGALHGVDDEALLHAAAGSAVQASHVAALVLAAGLDDHPFIAKFRLFEVGRWPIGLIGETLHLF